MCRFLVFDYLLIDYFSYFIKYLPASARDFVYSWRHAGCVRFHGIEITTLKTDELLLQSLLMLIYIT